MAKAKKTPTVTPKPKRRSRLQSDSPTVTPEFNSAPAATEFVPPTNPHWLSLGLAVVVLAIVLVAGFGGLYAGKVFPGVSADGVYLGGLDRSGAMAAMSSRFDEYQRHLIPINYGNTTTQISPQNLGVQYDAAAAADQALGFGRRGSWYQRLDDQLRSLVGQTRALAVFNFDDSRLSPYLKHLSDDIDRPVINASFDFAGNTAHIQPATIGGRLDQGLLILAIKERLATTSDEAIDAPVYSLAPVIGTDDLTAARDEANQYLAGPVTLTWSGSNQNVVSPTEIVSWINVTRQVPQDFEQTNNVTDIYPRAAKVTVALDDTKIAGYVAAVASKIDQPGQDAALTIQDGRATVFRPSRSGYALNQSKAVDDIKAALTKSDSNRQLALDIKVTQPSVTENNLNDLGINELLSEGYSTFPGSSSARLTNVRLGAKQYNGILLKPDEVFSFGAILGDVGPEQGYEPSLVIIGNKEEKQYGGGLCQVSSTAYRAALNAGLPIVERVNHAFAVDFYTQPYGIPGVDATIYYPQVDFKFKNDTGHYLLIQTIMQGTTLKFDFYGTKTKSGRIRGPYFVNGSLDATKPSQTVFYRDVLDLAGNVTKTDTVNTWYKASTDFTIVDNNQFH